MSPGAIADGETVTAAFDALEHALDAVEGLDTEMLCSRECLVLLERYEKLRRRLPAGEHRLINKLAREATPEELGGKLSHAIADWTLVGRAEAGGRVRDAADLGQRCGLTGEPMTPVLEATAAAQRAGKLGVEQVAVIRRFYHRLPGWIDVDTRERAEADLTRLASQYRPDQLAADHLTDLLNPDGNYADDDRARRRGLTLGNQQADGMSALTGWITPELRATLETVLAKLAAPGMCNPNDQTPCVDGAPATTPSTTTPAAQPNATTTASTPPYAPSWPPETWANPPPPPATPRLDHPQTPQRPHRMDPATPPGSRPTRTNTYHRANKLLTDRDDDNAP
ncbi:REPhypothetical protein [Mycobacterium triplex]|uniref:DUF222 domain-containing protein n=1 Tax=Mycobacterium triplex TaxID=47839 RepID=A0A024K247_9MYCO|nr:REPhypothetical protein [Mycobacterium triplex]